MWLPCLVSFGIFGLDFLALRLLLYLTLRLAFVQNIRADVVLPCLVVSLAVVVFVRLVVDVAPFRRLVASLPRLPFLLSWSVLLDYSAVFGPFYMLSASWLVVLGKLLILDLPLLLVLLLLILGPLT